MVRKAGRYERFQVHSYLNPESEGRWNAWYYGIYEVVEIDRSGKIVQVIENFHNNRDKAYAVAVQLNELDRGSHAQGMESQLV